MPMVPVAWAAVFPWHLLVHRGTHFSWHLGTLLHRHLDRHLSWHLDTLCDRPVLAHLLRDRSCYSGAVCAWHRHTHRDRHTVWDSHLARGLDRNFLTLPLSVGLALGRVLVVGNRCRMYNMRSSSMEQLSISISISFCISICFWLSVSFTLSQRMRVWMRCGKSKCRSRNLMMCNNMGINWSSYHMIHHSTVCLCGDMCLSAVLGHDILALLHVGGVHHCLVLGGALLLMMALLLRVGGTLLLWHLLHHSVALRHSVCGTLLLVLSYIVGHMLSVANCFGHGVTLLGCDHLIGHMALWSIVSMGIGITISTTPAMPIIMTIAWISFSCSVCRGIRCSICFSRAQ